MRTSLIIALLIVGFLSKAQRAPEIDSSYMLLLNPYVQIEATQAVNDLYNFKFDKSMRSLKYLKYEYGWHPLPYFLMGLNYWWRIQPNLKNTQYDDTFNAYMDTTITLAERLVDEEINEVEGTFFLAAAYGFKARLYSDRDKYVKAAWDGKKALKYLKRSKEFTAYSPELLFGDGLINYYGEWIRENYPMLRPLMFFMPDGDKKLGIKQLRTVSRNAFYSRTEAQFYLMRILYSDQRNFTEAGQLAEYLHETFPDNSYFHKMYARLLFRRGLRKQAEIECLDIMQKIKAGQVGYESNTGRYAAYFLGLIYKSRRQWNLSEHYFLRAEEFAEIAEQTDKGYYFESLNNLAYISLKNGNEKRAKHYYKKVKKMAKRKHPAWKRAKRGLKDM